MIKNFVSDMAHWVASGAKIVAQDVAEKRLNTCTACEHFKDDRCQKCGCFMRVKVALETATCPEKKW